MRKSQLQTSILIIRLAAIGEIVTASPVAKAIKDQRPNAIICWIVEPEYRTLLEDNPYIDEVICWDKKRWQTLLRQYRFISLWREIQSMKRTLRQRNFEFAIDLQGLFKSSFLAWLSKSKHRIGLSSREGSNLLMTKTISRNLGNLAQIGADYRYLVNQLGFPERDWQMFVPTPKENTHENLLPDSYRNENYAVICPFSTIPQKHWFDDYWQQLILRIRGRYQLRTIIVGGPEEKEKGESLARGCGALNLAGKTNLQQTAAFIKNASVLVGIDTGLTHMGHAFKIPTIALFGSTCPYSHTGLDTSMIIYLDRYCSPCKKNPTCKGKYECMRDITPDTVLTEMKSLMKTFN